MRVLLKASKERDVFADLIGMEVTFCSDIYTPWGAISHTKDEKAIISEITYTPGYWSKICTDIYMEPEISTFQINGVTSTGWIPDTFLEFTDLKQQ